jgi:DNA-binding NtrC family response regulator
MPPLRERPEDLPILAQEVLRPICKEIGRPVPKISPSGMKKLESYAWPGNVRELRNVLERAMLTQSGNELKSDDLIIDTAATAAVARAAAGSGLPSNEWEILPLDEMITRYVTAAVEATGGNARKAARALAISPSTLYARMKA